MMNDKDRIEQLEKENKLLRASRSLDTMDEVAYRELRAENERIQKKVWEAENETSIVKAVGINSPEMKNTKERIKELENSLAIASEVNDSHQRYNAKLQVRLTEVEEDNKKLSHQIEDRINYLRQKGLM